jgi:site-specific DNA-methyltransferase (adenine-specific)
MNPLPRGRVLIGDAQEQLASLPTSSIDCVVTSPPYYRLRDYGMAGQLGVERSVTDWVEHLRNVAGDVARVLTPTGTLWLNLGDSYARHARDGAARKSLLLAPERLALALVQDGWLLRNKVVWSKPSVMPTSATDRLRCSWEVVYVLAKQPRYFFDLDAIREPHTSHAPPLRQPAASRDSVRGPNAAGTSGLVALKQAGLPGHPLGKNPGDVWRMSTSTYRGDHPAMFPITLAQRAILAGCPERRCRACHAPHRRAVIRAIGGTATRGLLRPTCVCEAPSEPGLVLDPFIGSGTTAVAAEQVGRDWLGIELNPDFAALGRRRLHDARAGPSRSRDAGG